MTDTGSLLQAMALMPAVANPYLVSLRTGTQLDADTLEQYFVDNGAGPFHKQLQNHGWFSYTYTVFPAGGRPDSHQVPKYMSKIPDETLQQPVWVPPMRRLREPHAGAAASYTISEGRTVKDELTDAENYMVEAFHACQDAIWDAAAADDRTRFPAIQEKIEI